MNAEKEKRVVLDAQDFRNLVEGQEVKKPGVRIILSDIGLFSMMTAIRNRWPMAREGGAHDADG